MDGFMCCHVQLAIDNVQFWICGMCVSEKSCMSDSMCCHVQLAIDNVLAPYLGNQFGFSITKAANLAAIFGMLNFVARPFGGYLSDVMGRR